MNMILMSLRAALVEGNRGYACATRVIPNARPRTAWQPTATADQAVAAMVTADPFSAHHVSTKRSYLPREVPCLT